MPIITIREQQATTDGFDATVNFNNGATYPITIQNPFKPQQEKELEWYFEEWLAFPLANQTIAQRAKESIKNYGTNLFEQVFGQRKVYSEYDQVKSQLSDLEIVIESKTPDFQALHWEAMRDPDSPRPLAVDCVMLRKAIKSVSYQSNFAESPHINLLVVVARPDEEKDVGYRTISRPVVELIEQSQFPVNVDILRPGTFEALSRHLEAKGANFYHIIHLDLHGALLSYHNIKNPSKPERYFYSNRYGREDLQEFEGIRAFLAFEDIEAGKVDLVEAQELTDLLTGKGIPVCILNACQSGKQVTSPQNDQSPLTPLSKGGNNTNSPLSKGGNNADSPILKGENNTDSPPFEGGAGGGSNSRETSLGSRLMESGMQMVVAMGYSVTVSAAKLMMEQLYQHLFDDKAITEAIRLSRRELYNIKDRKAYFNQTIELEDWLLPVVYVNQQVNLKLRQFTPEEAERYYEGLGKKYRFNLPEYGFVGRDLDILKLEKALLRHNILLLRGMGGTGKTTLLNYLREWWQTTDFAENVFYFGYDQKAWTLEQILFEIGHQVYAKFEAASFQAMNPVAQVQKLAKTLKTGNYCLILDNLESITGQELAIQNTLPEAEREKIKHFLGLLVNGKTKVVLGSRSGENWLQDVTFKQNIYELQGLDGEARTELAEKILQRHVDGKRIPEIRKDGDFQRLMKLLAGYPLAMEVVLANLRSQSPGEILQGLESADLGLEALTPNPSPTGEGSSIYTEKTKSILKCVEYSHSNLSTEAQRLLLCLAPFSGFVLRLGLPNYAQELQKLEEFKDYDFSGFDAAIQEAINWGLLSPLALTPNPSPNVGRGENDRLLNIQPVFPYFLKTKLKEVDEATREALREGFKNHYRGLAGYYDGLMDSKNAQERQLGVFFCRLEYENLYQALLICLEKQEDITIFRCLDQYLDLIKDVQTQLKLAKFVCECAEKYPSDALEGEIGYYIGGAFRRLGNCYLDTKNYPQARESYQKSIELFEKNKAISEENKQSSIATTYYELGYAAQELREYAQAQQYYQQALAITVEYGDRYSQAFIYHNLGIVAMELREYAQAQQYYQQALAIKVEYGDRYEQAKTYHELGYAAQELREYAQAQQYYQQALAIKIEYGDRYSQALTYHNLGRVAQEMREYAQAQQYYQQALAIYVEYGDRYSQASTYHQLGMVAQELREYAQAQHYYQQALAIFVEYGDRYEQAGTYNQLGVVAKMLKEFAEAKSNYLKALQIYVDFNEQHYLQIVLRNIADLYQATQDQDLLSQSAAILGVSVEELQTLFDNAFS